LNAENKLRWKHTPTVDDAMLPKVGDRVEVNGYSADLDLRALVVASGRIGTDSAYPFVDNTDCL
jgi:hypothetical protein